MKFKIRKYKSDDDYIRMRDLLRDTLILNDGLERNWRPPRLDYWRWHFIATCDAVPLDGGTTLWETPVGKLAAFLHPVFMGEAFIQVHPNYRSARLEDEVLRYAESTLAAVNKDGMRALYTLVDDDDVLRKGVVYSRGYTPMGISVHRWYRDLDADLPGCDLPDRYRLRAMGGAEDYEARAWASWRAFHPGEGDEGFEGGDWFANLQAATLYRNELDLLAEAPNGEIGAFCTIFYDAVSSSGETVLVGTAAENQRRGLGKAVVLEGLKRLKMLGCRRVYANGYDPAANALYEAVLGKGYWADSWRKVVD